MEKGRKHSEETKRKISLARAKQVAPKGKSHWNYGRILDLEHKKKISDSLKGRKLSEKQKKKMSISAKKRIANSGIKPPHNIMWAEKNPNWKGEKVGYAGVHLWIRRNKMKPKLCEFCNQKPPEEVANLAGNYNRNISDYKWLCKKCHRNFDLDKRKKHKILQKEVRK